MALKYDVKISFQLQDAALAVYPAASADAVAIIYTHLPTPIRKELYKNIIQWLKSGGKVILETFCPELLKHFLNEPLQGLRDAYASQYAEKHASLEQKLSH